MVTVLLKIFKLRFFEKVNDFFLIFAMTVTIKTITPFQLDFEL